MRQSIPSNVWTILKAFPNQQVLQDSGQTSFVWTDDEGNLVLEKLVPPYSNCKPTWYMRPFVDSWTLKENQ